jgi:hypothetical protein
VQGHLKGSKESLALNNLSVNLAGSNLNLAFSGKVGNLMSISDIDLQLKGSGKDLAELEAIIEQKLPASSWQKSVHWSELSCPSWGPLN